MRIIPVYLTDIGKYDKIATATQTAGGIMANRRITKKRNKRMKINPAVAQSVAAEVQKASGNSQAEAAIADAAVNANAAETAPKAEVKAAAEKSAAKAEAKVTAAEAAAGENEETGKAKAKKMKSRFFVQYGGHEFEEQEILAKIKQKWKEEGKKVKDLQDVDIYAKPEEGKVYYTINGEISDSIVVF
jgi:hypothetical protein